MIVALVIAVPALGIPAYAFYLAYFARTSRQVPRAALRVTRPSV